MTTYALRLTYRESRNLADPPQEIDYEGRDVCYLHKSVSRNKRGYLVWKVTSEVHQSRRWSTLAGAEQYVASHFTHTATHGSYSRFTVEAID